MSGMLHNVITKRTYTFTSLAAGAASSSDVVLVRAIDVTDAKSLELVVRIWSANVGTGGGGAAALVVKAYPVSLTAESPDTDFLSTSVASVAITTTAATTPALKLGSLSTPFGHMVQIVLEADQDAAAAQTITATLSIDLLARDN